ncbi:MAG: hypothetical protein ACI915_004465 [Gammaproteobacteria bacterium]|jgi:hypothetical protein
MTLFGLVRGDNRASVEATTILTHGATDHSFHKGILPRAAWCSEYLFDSHVLDALPKLVPVNTIAIPN